MTSPLLPQLTGTRLSVESAMNQPTLIRDRIAKLADKRILLPKLFRTYGAQLQGAGMLYSVIKASDFFTADSLERRSPGAEYAVLRGQDPESKLAVVDDFGGRVEVMQEDIIRNNIARLENATIQLSNGIIRSLDRRAVAAIEAADVETIAVPLPWQELVTVGPLTDITPSASRPTASFAAAAELAELDLTAPTLDTLLVHPSQSAALKTAYAENLDAMLKSAGLELFSNPEVAEGTAYVVAAGAVGQVGFEIPLTVQVVPELLKRTNWVLSYCVPAFAVTNPGAIKKLTGLS